MKYLSLCLYVTKNYQPLCYLKKFLRSIERSVPVSGTFIFQWMLQKGYFVADEFKDIVFKEHKSYSSLILYFDNGVIQISKPFVMLRVRDCLFTCFLLGYWYGLSWRLDCKRWWAKGCISWTIAERAGQKKKSELQKDSIKNPTSWR